MKATIDAAGRVVIPREIRRQAGWPPGTELEVHWRDGRVEIEPAPATMTLVRRGRFLIAVADAPIEPLTTDTVEATRSALARQRAGEQ